MRWLAGILLSVICSLLCDTVQALPRRFIFQGPSQGWGVVTNQVATFKPGYIFSYTKILTSDELGSIFYEDETHKIPAIDCLVFTGTQADRSAEELSAISTYYETITAQQVLLELLRDEHLQRAPNGKLIAKIKRDLKALDAKTVALTKQRAGAKIASQRNRFNDQLRKLKGDQVAFELRLASERAKAEQWAVKHPFDEAAAREGEAYQALEVKRATAWSIVGPLIGE